MQLKVKYSGPWSENSGYAHANRNIITALYKSGVDVSTELQVYSHDKTDYGEEYQICKSLQDKKVDYKIKVLHITPNVYAKHKEVGKYHIGHLFWETTLVSKDWAWYLKEVDEIWTGSEYNKKCFVDSGFTRPIYVFPQPINTNLKNYDSIEIENKTGFTFLSIFQWTERKNPRALLEAYWTEFANDPNVTLVLKTYGLSFSQEQSRLIYQDIEKWKKELGIKKAPKVVVIDYLISDSEKHALIESCDCFVSAHRGEGWGVPQAEALIHAKPVISTNLGGVHEWISDQGMYKVPCTMTNVFGMPWAEQYTQDQQWGSVDIGALRAAMRDVYENREKAKQVGLQGKKEASEVLNFNHVGDMMKRRIAELEEVL